MKYLALILLFSLTPCYAASLKDEVVMPQAYQNDAGVVNPYVLARPWFESIDDKQLQEILKKMLAYNSTLAKMEATLDQVAADYDALKASGRLHIYGNVTAGILGNSSYHRSYLAGAIPVSYELDIRGKQRAEREASFNLLQAAQEDREALSIQLVIEAVQMYYDGLFTKKQILLVESLLITAQEQHKVYLNQFEQGLISREQSMASEGDIAELTILQESLKAYLVSMEHVLRIMCGEYPIDGWLLGEAYVPTYLQEIPIGLPSDLIDRRPDIRAMLKRFEAADLKVTSAKRDFIPKITLTTIGQKSSLDLKELVNGESVFWHAFAMVSLPIFDGEERKYTLQSQQAKFEQLKQDYRGLLLKALKEVEDGLNRGAHQLGIINEYEQRILSLTSLLQYHRVRYDHGVADILPVLKSRRDLLSVQMQLQQSKFQLVVCRLQLILALGGSWQ